MVGLESHFRLGPAKLDHGRLQPGLFPGQGLHGLGELQVFFVQFPGQGRETPAEQSDLVMAEIVRERADPILFHSRDQIGQDPQPADNDHPAKQDGYKDGRSHRGGGHHPRYAQALVGRAHGHGHGQANDEGAVGLRIVRFGAQLAIGQDGGALPGRGLHERPRALTRGNPGAQVRGHGSVEAPAGSIRVAQQALALAVEQVEKAAFGHTQLVEQLAIAIQIQGGDQHPHRLLGVVVNRHGKVHDRGLGHFAHDVVAEGKAFALQGIPEILPVAGVEADIAGHGRGHEFALAVAQENIGEIGLL